VTSVDMNLIFYCARSDQFLLLMLDCSSLKYSAVE
jgi:hypothetical protein